MYSNSEPFVFPWQMHNTESKRYHMGKSSRAIYTSVLMKSNQSKIHENVTLCSLLILMKYQKNFAWTLTGQKVYNFSHLTRNFSPQRYRTARSFLLMTAFNLQSLTLVFHATILIQFSANAEVASTQISVYITHKNLADLDGNKMEPFL